MNINLKNSAVLILAGGNSTRMGFPKAWLKLKDGRTFLSTIINQYKKIGVEDIIVVLNKNSIDQQWHNEYINCIKDARIIRNDYPEKDRLYSVYLGIKATNATSIIIHNVDNPCVEDDTISILLNNRKDDITIPKYLENNGHPVIINSLVKKTIINNYKNYKTLKDLFSEFKKHYVYINSDSILVNINTIEDLEKVTNELV